MSYPTPPERITHIPANNRVYPVPPNDRTVIIPDDE
jgi:hypothetical protein